MAAKWEEMAAMAGKENRPQGFTPSPPLLVVVAGAALALVVLLLYHHNRTTALGRGWSPVVEENSSLMGPPSAYNFHDDVEKACAGNPHRLPPFRGVQSFFDVLLSPDPHACYAWLKFGGELNFKTKMFSQAGERCVDGLLSTKFVCFNPEYRMNEDPCLVYAFSVPGEEQFEKDMALFSCEVHSFVQYRNSAFDHVQRSKYYHQHSWILSDDYREERVKIQGRFDRTPVGRHLDYKTDRYRSLDFMIRNLGHQNSEIKLVKSDATKKGELLLRQIFKYRNEFDIKQAAVMIFLSPENDVKRYEDLYKLFDGLACAGYRFARVAPETVYMKTVHLHETNQTYHPAFTVNFVKKINF